MIVLSVSSGTSADGLDVGLADLDWSDDGDVVLRRTRTWTEPWPEDLAARVLALLDPNSTTAAELCAVDNAVGQAVADVAARAVARSREELGEAPSVVVSSGQTVHHETRGDRCLGTLQLGQPAWVVEATGLPVVSDLRARDVAAGGHGAPLASTLDALWLGDHAAGGPGTARAALNLGGIANVTVVGPGRVLAWDTGPANCLLDVAADRATAGRLRYDAGGALARQGRVHEALLADLRTHPYFLLAAPKSTGRETFSEGYLDDTLRRHPDLSGPDLPWPDVVATLTELTAVTVAEALAGYDVGEVIASGGGTANPALMDALRGRLEGAALTVSDEHGIPASGKEAVLWALLGFLTWHGVPGASPATGARVPRVLGRISPGDAPLELPPPRQRPPRRLVLAVPEAAR